MKPDERYTWRACADGYTDTGLRTGITEDDAICQLADYEDTGLSPKEINYLMSPVDIDQSEEDTENA